MRSDPDTPAPARPCAVGDSPAPAETLSIAVMEPVDPSHVPAPVNGAEKLVFAQLYETLLDVDCDGRLRPALARLTVDASGARVVLTLREGARFNTGTPMAVTDVLAAWRATAAQPTDAGRLARDIADATTILDERTLSVALPDTERLRLADRALAVYRPAAHSVWPEGSGPYRPVVSQKPAGVLLAPMSPADPHLVFQQAGGGDARDAIDAGADVLVTGDPVAVSYAGTRPGLAVAPLPWTRTYALLLPASQRPFWPESRPDSEIADLRGSLARDAVRADARPAPPILPFCGPARPVSEAALLTLRLDRRLVYPFADPVARGLAERLVALEGSTVAAGLAADAFASALRTPADPGYIVALPRAGVAPCHSRDTFDSIIRALARGARLVPLIDVREHAIVRRGAVSATVSWDGTLLFGQAGGRP